MKRITIIISAIVFIVVFAITTIGQDATTMSQTTTQPVVPSGQTSAPTDSVYSMFEKGSIVFIPGMAAFEIKATDTGSGVSAIEYSIDDRGYVTYREPLAIAKEGYHTVNYRVLDNVGNIAYEKTVLLCVDKSAPIVQLIPSSYVFEYKGLNFIPPGYTFIVRSLDTYSGVKSSYVALNGDNFVNYEKPMVFDQGGTYMIKYYALDNVGNTNTVAFYQFVVDAEKPIAEIIPSAPFFKNEGINYASTSYTYSVKALDTQSGVKIILVSIDGGEFIPYAGELSFTEEGEHSIAVSVIDNVNNTSEEIALKIVVDNTPPTSQYNISIGQ